MTLNNNDVENNKNESGEQEGSFCYKCDKMCTEKWAIDESFVVCTVCGSLLKLPSTRQSPNTD